MNSDCYNLEFNRVSNAAVEQHFGQEQSQQSHTVVAEIYGENTEENLLNDYELVNNEEFDDDDENVEKYKRKPQKDDRAEQTVAQHNVMPINLENNYKQNVRLGADKIALKSQTTKVDKSIAQETETPTVAGGLHKIQKPQQQQLQQQQHVTQRGAFTIVPIGVARRHTTIAGGAGNNLPEIVLTSFDNKCNALARPLAAKKSASVTFCSTFKPITAAMLPTATGATATTTAFDCFGAKTTAAPAAYDDSNELVSQPGSSTSPESYVDNILSAASSVSVRSSSLSSGAGVGADFETSFKTIKLQQKTQQHEQFQQQQLAKQLKEKPQQKHVQETAKIMRVNRALNSKSTELHRMSTTAEATITTKQNVVAAALTDAAAAAVINALHEQKKQQQQVVEEQQQQLTQNATALQAPASATNSSRSSPSPSHNVATSSVSDVTAHSCSPELKCLICCQMFRDPRTLNCLHSFCFQCLVDENFKQDSSIPFWSQPSAEGVHWKAQTHANSHRSSKESSPELSLNSLAIATTTTAPALQRQRSSFTFRRKKSLERTLIKIKSNGSSSQHSSPSRQPSMINDDKSRSIKCKICHLNTELPIGGIRQLPQNYLIVRKIDEFKHKPDESVKSNVCCSLCFEETEATYHCISCALKLCMLCKEAHERQRNTANHKIKNILEQRKIRRKKHPDSDRFTLKCSMHAGFEMRSFCTTCLQIACADCLVLLHKGHKHESISKAFATFSKIVRESTEQIRPLCSYAEHSIERLNQIAKDVNDKCDAVQVEIETFTNQYLEALEMHRRTLLQQVQRARESKVEMILEQQLDLEKRATVALEAVHFSQELCGIGSDVELLSFVSILLKRFEYCSQFKAPQDPKIANSLHFVPQIRAPSNKSQNNIPLFGIITTQSVEPTFCTINIEAFTQLRLHNKAEFVLQSRDTEGALLCHGGLKIRTHLKYKDIHAKYLKVEISDERDGTYGLSFVPDVQGTLLLTVTINDKHIKGSPFTLLAHSVLPHSGIYHCCAFCSSKGNKMTHCACPGRMAGFNGCGHGHAGHPGHRHWSCCGNVAENSECTEANKLLNH